MHLYLELRQTHAAEIVMVINSGINILTIHEQWFQEHDTQLKHFNNHPQRPFNYYKDRA